MITWLASYPKSGNTWMRVFLTNYIRNNDQPANINELEGGPIASARTWFDEWSGIEASALSDSVITRLRPEVYRCMVRENLQMLYMKVHDAWMLTDRGEPLFPADVTAGVIYILRNPLDMAASCANHWGIPLEKAVDNLCNPAFVMARSERELNNQLSQVVKCWSGHLKSWIDESGLPVLTVRYEDMLSLSEHTFSQVVRFCGLPLDPDRVRKAISFSEFRILQHQEREKGFHERSPSTSGQFFRRGQAGSWRDELPPELVRRLIDAHGDMMRRFGYLEEATRGD